MMKLLLPKARQTNIVVQDLGKELLIYDLTTHSAFQLNETSKIVFAACDGRHTFAELTHKYKLPEQIIYLALDELKKQNLLATGAEYFSPFAEMSRRAVIRKVGLASMIALPVISALVAPTAAQAQSAQATCATSGMCFCKFTANTLAGTSCSVSDPVYTGTCRTTGADACIACKTIANCSANNLCQGVCSTTFIV